MRSKKITRKVKRTTNKRKSNRRLTKKFRKHRKKYFGGGDPPPPPLTDTPPLTRKSSRGMQLLSSEELREEETLEQVLQRKKVKSRILREQKTAEIEFYRNCFEGKPVNRVFLSVKDVKPPSFSYTTQTMVDDTKIKEFVESKIEFGPQIVTFAVGRYNHAILVDVQKDGDIMISDWKGDPRDPYNTNSQFIDNPDYDNYFDLLNSLKEKYPGKEIKFYYINPYLKQEAEKVNNLKGNAGGCSHYVYSWVPFFYKKVGTTYVYSEPDCTSKK